MSINPEFDKVQTSEVITVSSSNGIECKLPLTEEEFKDLISAEVSTSLTQVDCYNKEVKYSGRAIFTVVYKSENVIKKHEAGVEFSFKSDFDKCLEGMVCLAEAKGENVKVNFLNGIAMASAVIIFNGEITKAKEIEYFANEPQIMVKKENLDYAYEVCKVKREGKIEDEFDLPILVGDILSHREKVTINNCQCGIGVVIVDGEVELSMLICELEQTKEPLPSVKTIPFRMEVECRDALPEYFSCAFSCIKNSSLKVYVDEAKNKSAVSVEICLEINSKVYSYNTFSYGVDAYSNECEIKLNNEYKCIDKILGFKCLENKISSEISFNNENSRLICLINDKIEDVKYDIVDGYILIEGALSLSCLFLGESYFTENVLLPFSSKIKIDGNKFSFIKCEAVNTKVSKNSVDFTLKVCFLDIEECKFKAITALEEGQKKKPNNSAISVYIPSPNETLWDVSKALGVKEEVILKTNDNLEFPLTGNERIVVYREK